ncbi:MAG TPA: hypothetical protein QGF63_18565, partial [Alphaproteobacteria bacterium]|nr:hypothetical protein [Alphaproteobacteria bacterium]
LRYRKRRSQEVVHHTVLPYGFLLGHRHYLIAMMDHPKAVKCIPFSVPNIETAEILEDYFERDSSFSLREYPVGATATRRP